MHVCVGRAVHQHAVTYLCDKNKHSFISSDENNLGEGQSISVLSSTGVSQPNVVMVALPEYHSRPNVVLQLEEIGMDRECFREEPKAQLHLMVRVVCIMIACATSIT